MVWKSNGYFKEMLDLAAYMCYHTFKAYFLVILSFRTFCISENLCFYFAEKSNSRDLRGCLAEYGDYSEPCEVIKISLCKLAC